MNAVAQTFNSKALKLGVWPREEFEFALLSIVTFAIPMIFRHPQILVGTIVNFTLIMSALHVRGMKKNMVLCILPSLSVIGSNILFGTLTPFVIMLAPAIWAGNILMVYLIKLLHAQENKNMAFSFLASIAAKTLLIGAYAFLLIKTSVVPASFLYSMSVLQFITAAIGSIAAFAVLFAGSAFQPRSR